MISLQWYSLNLLMHIDSIHGEDLELFYRIICVKMELFKWRNVFFLPRFKMQFYVCIYALLTVVIRELFCVKNGTVLQNCLCKNGTSSKWNCLEKFVFFSKKL